VKHRFLYGRPIVFVFMLLTFLRPALAEEVKHPTEKEISVVITVLLDIENLVNNFNRSLLPESEKSLDPSAFLYLLGSLMHKSQNLSYLLHVQKLPPGVYDLSVKLLDENMSQFGLLVTTPITVDAEISVERYGVDYVKQLRDKYHRIAPIVAKLDAIYMDCLRNLTRSNGNYAPASGSSSMIPMGQTPSDGRGTHCNGMIRDDL